MGKMTYRVWGRPWPAKTRKPLYFSMVFELVGLVPLLVLFGIAQPDMYRSKMWNIGFQNHFNSNPLMILYAYANHRPLPNVPFVWSQALTNFNVAISVISLFVLLTRMIATIMKVYRPVMGLFVSITLTALYATSVYGQMGPDYADPRYPSPIAWYISKSCDYAKPFGAESSCRLAKGTFAATVYMLALYVMTLALAIWAMWPNKMLDLEEDSDDDDYSPKSSTRTEQKQWEMQPPRTPRMTSPTPFTPRTQAFHTLDRKLPLRTS